jgi:hypothetical protein
MDLKHLTIYFMIRYPMQEAGSSVVILNYVSIHVNYNIIYRSVTLISINFIYTTHALVFIDYNRSTTNNYMSKVEDIKLLTYFLI